MINKIKRKLFGILRDLRNFYLFNFNRNYIRISLSKRKGECKICGNCCSSCHLLKDNKCVVYNDRPRWCNKDFPIDKLDLKLADIKNCGYYWE